MKVRNGFVSNSSSSSFIITDNNNIEKVKEIINNIGYEDYYELDGVLYTSFISDCSDEYGEISELSSDSVDGGGSYPYDEEAFVELEGDRGCDSVWIDKKIIKNCCKNKCYDELKSLDNPKVDAILLKYKEMWK